MKGTWVLPPLVIKATVIVRKADGSIRYGPGAKPGSYGEPEKDIAATKDMAVAGAKYGLDNPLKMWSTLPTE